MAMYYCWFHQRSDFMNTKDVEHLFYWQDQVHGRGVASIHFNPHEASISEKNMNISMKLTRNIWEVLHFTIFVGTIFTIFVVSTAAARSAGDSGGITGNRRALVATGCLHSFIKLFDYLKLKNNMEFLLCPLKWSD